MAQNYITTIINTKTLMLNSLIILNTFSVFKAFHIHCYPDNNRISQLNITLILGEGGGVEKVRLTEHHLVNSWQRQDLNQERPDASLKLCSTSSQTQLGHRYQDIGYRLILVRVFQNCFKLAQNLIYSHTSVQDRKSVAYPNISFSGT